MEIVICKNCKGTGFVYFDVGTHKSEYEYQTCTVCMGSGRMELKVIEKRIPFVPDINKAYKR